MDSIVIIVYELRQMYIVYLNIIIFFLLHWSYEIYNLGSMAPLM